MQSNHARAGGSSQDAGPRSPRPRLATGLAGRFRAASLAGACLGLAVLGARADDPAPNLLQGSFETGTTAADPWAGVDDQGNLRVWQGWQLAVNDDGQIGKESFSPGLAVGDLNGDKLPDVIVADARGFFWYFPNSGKPGAPAFTHGEIMPIWLGRSAWEGDVVPRIQLIDYAGDGKLDLVAGNYAGQLFLLYNRGSATEPHIHMPYDRNTLVTPTHTEGLLWCNYLAPFLYDWSGTGRLDLVMGDGSYSANSIYLFTNQGDNQRPVYNERQMTKLIAGLGREHLTPQVVDWNHDGKPDILAGERTGCVDLYLNHAASASSPPVFDEDHPQRVSFNGVDKIGALSTVCAADLNGDKLFDLLVGTPDGQILYSLNTGTVDAPKFGPLVPLKGVNPYPKIVKPMHWEIDRFQPYGSPYEVLECTNATIEKGFAPPPDFNGTGALKFSILKPQATVFHDFYAPDTEDNPGADRRQIDYGWINLKTDTRYAVQFWVRTTGNVSNLTWHIEGKQPDSRNASVQYKISTSGEDCPTGDTWNHVEQDLRVPSQDDLSEQNAGGYFSLSWEGDGTLYLDDFSCRKGN